MTKNYYYITKESFTEQKTLEACFNYDNVFEERVSDYFETPEQAREETVRLNIPTVDEVEYNDNHNWYNRNHWVISEIEVDCSEEMEENEILEEYIDNNAMSWNADDYSTFECYVEINDKVVIFNDYNAAKRLVKELDSIIDRNKEEKRLCDVYGGIEEYSKVTFFCYKNATKEVTANEMVEMISNDFGN